VLTPDGQDTIVELPHRGLPTPELPSHQSGWETLLDRLVHSAEPRARCSPAAQGLVELGRHASFPDALSAKIRSRPVAVWRRLGRHVLVGVDTRA
jgi:hypothetical protein